MTPTIDTGSSSRLYTLLTVARHTQIMRTNLALLATALLFVMAACGSNADTPAAETTAAADTEAATTQPDSEAETSAEPAAQDEGDSAEQGDGAQNGAPKTLDEYLGTSVGLVRGGGGGGFGGGAGFDQDEVIEQQRLIQLATQQCMLLQGFEYVPEEVGDGLRFFLATQQTGSSPLEYAETQGFGISTRFDAILEGEVDFAETATPNEDHLATLSEGEADAWQFALRGEPPTRNEQGQLIDPETGEVIQGARRGPTGGCALEAQEEVRGDFDQLAALADEFDELEERIAADPRIAEIALNWQDCMRAGGYDYQDESEARQAINQDFRPLLRSFFQGQGAAQGGQGGGQGGGNALARVAGLELTTEQEAELAALQEVERALAVASVTCQGETAEEIDEITLRYESEFVEANRAALEAFAS